jgi:extracellular factor (EF) 3-hydroxypalmitic acid methyl ester biosynthesis protein
MDRLCEGLMSLRAARVRDQWTRLGDRVRQHRLHALLLNSPFTWRAFAKPRGYAGDAELIDLIYGCGRRPSNLSTLGAGLYAWEFESAGCRSVRHRRMRVAREIDDAATNRAVASVLSVACGHLREAELSAAMRDRRVRVTAIDRDAASVALVAHEYGSCGVTACVGTVLDLLRRRHSESEFNLAYAAGLYDYLDTQVATALTAALFRTVAPGGRLLIANFTPEMRDAAYMETCMDWRLIYRDESQMEALLQRVASHEVMRLDQFRDPEGNITYMRVVRR